MKIKLRVKHTPAGNPGSWLKSRLKFSMDGKKSEIERMEQAIRWALRLEGENENSSA